MFADAQSRCPGPRPRFDTSNQISTFWDRLYLQILKLAHEHGQERVEELLSRFKDTPALSLDHIRQDLGEQKQWRDDAQEIEPDLKPYDRLLSEEVSHG